MDKYLPHSGGENKSNLVRLIIALGFSDLTNPELSVEESLS